MSTMEISPLECTRVQAQLLEYLGDQHMRLKHKFSMTPTIAVAVSTGPNLRMEGVKTMRQARTSGVTCGAKGRLTLTEEITNEAGDELFPPSAGAARQGRRGLRPPFAIAACRNLTSQIDILANVRQVVIDVASAANRLGSHRPAAPSGSCCCKLDRVDRRADPLPFARALVREIRYPYAAEAFEVFECPGCPARPRSGPGRAELPLAHVRVVQPDEKRLDDHIGALGGGTATGHLIASLPARHNVERPGRVQGERRAVNRRPAVQCDDDRGQAGQQVLEERAIPFVRAGDDGYFGSRPRP